MAFASIKYSAAFVGFTKRNIGGVLRWTRNGYQVMIHSEDLTSADFSFDREVDDISVRNSNLF